jgi:hypothetical protein
MRAIADCNNRRALVQTLGAERLAVPSSLNVSSLQFAKALSRTEQFMAPIQLSVRHTPQCAEKLGA